jgi:alpha-tubulin suppressor-like RCC1 family protein
MAAVYTCGSGEKGQLGNGRTGEHIATGNRTGFDVESEPSEKPTHPSRSVRSWTLTLTTIALVPVKGLDEKKIVHIACGQQHSIALDEDGYGLFVSSWKCD